MYSSDLQLIRWEIREGALERLRLSRSGRKKTTVVPVEEHERFMKNLEEKEKALAE